VQDHLDQGVDVGVDHRLAGHADRGGDMSGTTGRQRPPLRVRLVFGLQKEPDYLTMSDEALVAFRDAANRKAASPLARVITGFPDRRATIGCSS
jgi:hypothetical protein